MGTVEQGGNPRFFQSFGMFPNNIHESEFHQTHVGSVQKGESPCFLDFIGMFPRKPHDLLGPHSLKEPFVMIGKLTLSKSSKTKTYPWSSFSVSFPRTITS